MPQDGPIVPSTTLVLAAVSALLALAPGTLEPVPQRTPPLSADAVSAGAQGTAVRERPRIREIGIEIGRFEPGPLNAITDVDGVLVGQVSLRREDSIRTGVTAVLPHDGDLFREEVPAAIAVGNGFGKLLGVTQVNELGEIETPVLLTGTLSVWRAADALVDILLARPVNRDVRSINPVVGETNDGFLSDVRARPVTRRNVRTALDDAAPGRVEEGSVGAGTGTVAMGWKGGIGTASRIVPADGADYTLGVLVQTNYGGGRLLVDGVSVGEELGRDGLEPRDDRSASSEPGDEGSVMIVLATDAPLAHRELQRVASRTFLGIARTGSYMGHGSGDYAISFSTDRSSPRRTGGDLLSSLFEAAVEATQEAALNSLFRATTVDGHRGTARALPLPEVIRILRAHGREVGEPDAP